MIAGPLGLSMGAAVGLSAALGILIPIGSAIGRMFMETSGAGKSLKDTVGDLSSSFDTYIDSVSKANSSTEDLLKTYGRITPEILELEERLQALQLRQVALDAQATAKAISNFNFGGALMGGELADIKATFDTTIDGARMLEAAILAVGQAEGPEDTLLAIQALSAEAIRASGGIDKLTAEQIKFLQQVTASEQEFQRLVNIIGIAENSLSNVVKKLDDIQASFKSSPKFELFTDMTGVNSSLRSMSKGYKIAQDTAKEMAKLNKELDTSNQIQTKKNQLLITSVSDCVALTRRNGNRITRPNGTSFFAKGHFCFTNQNVVNLFCHRVMMRRGRSTRCQTCLSQRLLCDCRVSMSEQLTNRRPISRCKRNSIFLIGYVHILSSHFLFVPCLFLRKAYYPEENQPD